MHKTDFLLSLDYELFFGKKPGSVQHCMITPTQKLISVLDKFNAKVSLFVDVGFLVKLREYGQQYPELIEQYKQIQTQLLTLSEQGHDIQLHIHPHWYDSTYDHEGWKITTERYRLHDFSEREVNDIVKSYKEELQHFTVHDIFAYRAGGWCIQPFDRLQSALENHNIWLDSTVFSGGHSDDPTRYFNFHALPPKAHWSFSNDPLLEDENGFFTELPISSFKTSPLFFWKLAFRKKFSGQQFKPFGDGQAMVAHGNYYIERLTKTTHGPVMIDGAKAGQLQQAFITHKKSTPPKAVFNVMGHPKSLCEFSLIKLEQFLEKNNNLNFITFQDLKNLKNNNLHSI
ncbi:hypothetical protein CW745_08815 [Psychromonas sp. psych-6C06]|uniref:hypothetical protein n=1 Tax=Psychromonas sp. psych-6C06 TaxID=2058089 RepID=UPI000C329F31|nr:hypothetical protein [Psychromonas sp. psych-6C06]PKF61429.1 hypothetical protein CW745_08815 [Psychromonas sp. psych-6C06]